MNKIKQKFLVIRVQKGDSEAFREIYQVFSDKIYRFIFFRLAEKDEARDLLQETFLRLWDYLNNKENRIENLQAFIYKIAKNLIADYYKKRNIVDDIDKVSYKLGKEPDLDQRIDIEIDIVKINTQLSQLKIPEHREIIVLKYLDQLSHKEIAEIMDKSEQAVRSLLHRAVKSLKEIAQSETKNGSK